MKREEVGLICVVVSECVVEVVACLMGAGNIDHAEAFRLLSSHEVHIA